jgi:predicted small secreted protein
MKKLFFFVMISALLSACNTFQGLGKDIEKGGEIIQDNAK